MIVIIDYGIGNLRSIQNMLRKIGADAHISSDPKEIGSADKLILPGVGAFDMAMARMEESNLKPVLNEMVLEKHAPILGICLGMQIMTKRSAEGKLPGLGWIDAEIVRFRFPPEVQGSLKIPHMGWNIVNIKKNVPLFSTSHTDEPRFYFVHSYHAVCNDPSDVLTTTLHGYEFVSSFARKNILGVQFHPEKSHQFGMHLLRNFVEKPVC